MKKILLVSLMLISMLAFRAYAVPPTELQKQASWELPTTRTDGSLLDITEVSETRIYCGIDENSLDQVAAVSAPDTSVTISMPLDTSVCTATVVDISGLESEYSNFVPVKGQPNPPGNLFILTITISSQ